MKYELIYNQLVNKANSEQRIKSTDNYFEAHHIVPRCLGGLDTKENIVLLTAREHYIAHKLLTMIYPSNNKLSLALWCMVSLKSRNRDYRISSREYEELKLLVSKRMSGKNNPVHKMQVNPFQRPEIIEKIKLKNKGKKLSEETKNKISQKAVGRKQTEETKNKIRLGNIGKVVTDYTRQKISKANTGRKKSEQEIEKIRLRLIGVPNAKTSETNKRLNSMKFTCQHCNRTIGGKANFIRFHNDNCKSKNNVK